MPRNISGRNRVIVKKTAAPKADTSKASVGRRHGVGSAATRRPDAVQAHIESKKGMSRCPQCGSLYYDKHWHSPEALTWERTTLYLAPLKDTLCGECKAGRLSPGGIPSGYAGEVTLSGSWTPQERFEMLHMVRNVGKRAMLRNPQDRIIRILENAGDIRVYTAINQLAIAIGKQVHSSRKGGELHITWSSDDKPVRVTWKKA